MRPISLIINICNDFTNNGNNIKGKDQLKDVIYKLRQKGIDMPFYNWFISNNGIICPELEDDIEKLTLFQIFNIDNQTIEISNKNKEYVKIIIDQTKDEYDKIKPEIIEILNRY